MNQLAAALSELLGKGLYTPSEAALYARIHTTTMSRWLFGDARGEAVLRPQLGARDERYVTFLDLVQSLAIRNIRVKHGIPLQKIREALDAARTRYQMPYPFAAEHVTFLFNKEILVLPPGYEDPVQVTGKQRHQGVMARIVEPYLKDLTFGPEQLAVRYRAYAWGGVEVDMCPDYRFGEPLVGETGYTARALWEACETEGSYEAAAEAYGVTAEAAEAAYRYYDFLQGKAAA